MSGPTSRRRGWPAGLIGALALVATVESLLARHELLFTTPARLEWRLSRKAATERAPACDVIGLGTSMSKLGIYPSVVERTSKLRMFNLSECAGRMPGFYFKLRKALAAGANPKAVLLEVNPTYAALPLTEGLVDWPDMLDPLESLDLAWNTGDPTFFASTVLARYVPSINARAEIRAAIVAALGGTSATYGGVTPALVRHMDFNAGAFVRRRDAPFRGDITFLEQVVYLDPRRTTFDPVSVRYMKRILDLCSSEGIQVFWVIPPFAPTLQACREQMGLDAAYTAFARDMQRAYPGLVVVDARRSGYGLPAFGDASHLDIPGATTFSAEVGRILRESLPPAVGDPRWVDLPAYVERTIDAPLDDFARSSKVAAGPGAVRR